MLPSWATLAQPLQDSVCRLSVSRLARYLLILFQASVRAYGAQRAFRLESYRRIDRYSRAARTNYNLNRWISTRIETLGAVFASGLGTYLLYGPGSRTMLASNIGFALAMAIQVNTMLLACVRLLSVRLPALGHIFLISLHRSDFMPASSRTVTGQCLYFPRKWPRDDNHNPAWNA